VSYARDVFEQFTDRAHRVVVLAQEEARLLGHNFGTEHILLGLIHEGEGVAATALASLDISREAVRAEVEEIIGHGGTAPSGHIPFTPPRRFSSSRCGRRCNSATTPSEPNTSFSGSSASARVSLRRRWSDWVPTSIAYDAPSSR
jgi:ATP-dependent Clp protease ATP-binding subunit ClpA